MRNLLKNRLFYLVILILLVGGLFSVSLFKTQIVKGAEYAELNRSTSVYTNTTEAARGEIVDRNGEMCIRDSPYTVRHGDRIAQLVLTPIFTPPIQEVEELAATGRGEGRFGSTGKR